MLDRDGMALAAVLLSAASSVNEQIHAGVVERGFGDIRPAHGFAFVRIAPAGATTGEIAEHLGVTKQAASQLVEELVGKGYVRRARHPSDARARLIVLTDRGWACTRAAEEAAGDLIRRWTAVLGPDRIAALYADLSRVVPPGRLRPAW